MISKYGMSREAMHYGNIVESSLPLITDSEVYEPLEADLDKIATLFKNKMGRFMEKRRRNKTYYKIGKEKKFYINELVMYKVYRPESLLHPTYIGPARIIDLHLMGATLRDPKTGSTFSVGFDNLRKIDFDELLTLLPQNFDSEIAETLGTYRYRRAVVEPDQVSRVQDSQNPDSDPEEKSDENSEQPADPANADGGTPYLADTTGESKSEVKDGGKPSLVNPDHKDEEFVRRTRSGKIFNVKTCNIPGKIREAVKKCTLRMTVIPKTVHDKNAVPSGPCLKRRYVNQPFRKTEPNFVWEPGAATQFTEDSLGKVVSFKEAIKNSSMFQQSKPCTQEFVLRSESRPNRVKFGTITVFFI